MTTEYFRVRNGLTIGEDKFTVDALTGDTVIAGDLTVNGTTVTVNTTDLNVKDNKITLNYGVTGTPTLDAGIEVERGSETNSALNWNESTHKWEQNRAGTTTVIPVSTTELAEGTNEYFTTQKARDSISVTDAGGFGSFGYDSGTGVITYTGTSVTEVRSAFSAGTGVTITDGTIAIGQSVATSADVSFNSATFSKSIVTGGGALNGGGQIPGYVYPGIGTLNGNGVFMTNAGGNTSAGFRIRDAMLDKNAPFNASTGCNLLLEASRGSNASPVNLNSGDLIGGFGFSGYANGAWLGSTNNYPNATIAANTTEAWSSATGMGAELRFTVQPTATALTSTSRVRAMTVRAANIEMRAPLVFFNGSNGQQVITASGQAVNTTSAVTYFNPSGNWTSTLAAGTDGQVKMLACPVSTGATMTITVTNAGWPGGTITFNRGGQSCTLLYVNSKWMPVGNEGANFNTTVYGCFHKVANVTAAAANTVYNFDWYTDTSVHVGNKGVTVTSGQPTRVNINTAGTYTAFLEMQVKNTDNQDRTAWIWLAKNGTDLAETRIKVVLLKEWQQVISKLWCLDNIVANDYIELRFAVDNPSGISLVYEAAQASPFAMPAQPSATFTVVPVGA